ncbi:unnamed protein product, partial [Lymnaea stagnalis]
CNATPTSPYLYGPSRYVVQLSGTFSFIVSCIFVVLLHRTDTIRNKVYHFVKSWRSEAVAALKGGVMRFCLETYLANDYRGELPTTIVIGIIVREGEDVSI